MMGFKWKKSIKMNISSEKTLGGYSGLPDHPGWGLGDKNSYGWPPFVSRFKHMVCEVSSEKKVHQHSKYPLRRYFEDVRDKPDGP